MKIGCPNCGQHYEVEAGAIDRYYRCTECGEVFQGINAKLIKARRYRRKSKNADGADAPDSIRPAARTTSLPVPKSQPDTAPSNPVPSASDDVPETANSIAAPNFSGDFGSADERRVPLFPVLMLALLLVALLILCVQSVRLSRLDTDSRKLAGRVERLNSELDALKTALRK